MCSEPCVAAGFSLRKSCSPLAPVVPPPPWGERGQRDSELKMLNPFRMDTVAGCAGC